MVRVVLPSAQRPGPSAPGHSDRVLQLRPSHHEAGAFSAQIDSEQEQWKAEQQVTEERRQKERVRDALIRQSLTQYYLHNPPKPPLTVPPHLQASSGEDSLLDSI